MSREVHSFPSGDRAFGGAAKAALASLDARLATDKIAHALADLLRPTYPAVTVHRQDAQARVFDVDIWYAFRDGRS
jgi:hypothetical protein